MWHRHAPTHACTHTTNSYGLMLGQNIKGVLVVLVAVITVVVLLKVLLLVAVRSNIGSG